MKSDADYRRDAALLWRAAIAAYVLAFALAAVGGILSTPRSTYSRIVTDCIMAGGEWDMVFHGRTPDRNMYSCVAEGNLLTLIPNPNRE